MAVSGVLERDAASPLVLDATIVTIALPQSQLQLGIVGFALASGFLVLAGLVVLALVRGGKQAPTTEGASVHFG